MSSSGEFPNPFEFMGAIVRAWGHVTHEAIQAEGKEARKKSLSLGYPSRLENTETMLAFGYIVRAGEKTENNRIMQSIIVKALAEATPMDEDLTDEKRKAEKRRIEQTIRQDVKRRVDALEHYNLVIRKHLNPVAVELSPSPEGVEFNVSFNKAFQKEISKLGKKDN